MVASGNRDRARHELSHTAAARRLLPSQSGGREARGRRDARTLRAPQTRIVKLYFVRHGEPDYHGLTARAHVPHPDVVPLTPVGRLQIDTIARDYRLQEAEAVLSSSYARALESAALLSASLNKPFYVEYDLHEWRPNKGAAPADPEAVERAADALRRGEDAAPGPWETLADVRERVFGVLNRYRRFERLVVVTHAVVIASVVGMPRAVEHAEIVPMELDPSAPSAPRATAARRL